MADIIGLTASIIAVIQLTGALSTLTQGYISGVKRATSDRQKLVEELTSLGQVLEHLKVEITPAGCTGTIEKTMMLQGLEVPLRNCRTELQALVTKMQPVKGLRGAWRKLKWPLEEAETMQCIERVERYKTLFHFALTADHSAVLRRIEESGASTSVAVQGLQKDVAAEAAAQEEWRRKDRDKQIVKKRKIILSWLLPGSFEDIHVDISRNRQEGTGTWLLKALQDLGWEQGSVLLIWGHGIAGAGKTFLSSRIIDNLRDKAPTANYGVIYVYFDYNEQDRQKPIHVFASLVKQLATQIPGPHIHTHLESLYDSLESGVKRPTLNELYDTLLTMSASFTRVFCIFDALDECHPENQRRELLPLIRRMEGDGFSLFVTSRPYPEDVSVCFHDVPKIELLATKEDIKRYIVEKFNGNSRLKLLIQTPARKEKVISELADCAGGMFLLVRYHIEYLRQQVTLKKIMTELDKLKSSSTGTRSLDPTYDRALQTLRGQHPDRVDLATKILSWLVRARRTLTVHELQVAVSVEQNRYELDELDLPETETLLDVCAGLVTIDESTNTIKLAHLTVHEYLQSHSIIPQDVEFKIAMACVTCVSFDAFAKSGSGELQSVAYPFLEYATHHVSYHLTSACDDDQSTNLILTALNQAASDSREKVVKFLLDSLADPAALDKTGDTALHWSASKGFEEVVKLLLDRGANLSALDKNGCTVLYRAAAGGHEGMVELLLEHGASLSDLDNDGETVLSRAAREGNVGVVKLLLEHGADTSILDKNGNTILYRAASEGHEKVAKLLLEYGAKISALDEHPVTALNRAAHEGNEGVVKLLLERGTDYSVRNKKGETALHLAAFNGNEGVIKLFLERKVDLSIRNKKGETPLHLAAFSGNERVVKLLLECGADVLALDENGGSALDRAAHEANEGVAKLLLEHGADLSAVDDEGDTVLHLAALKGSEVMVKLFLDHGADASARNNLKHTAVYYAVDEEHEEILKLLLEHGAETSAVNLEGDTALRLAVLKGNEVMAKLLLDHGVDPSICNSYGRSTLYCAVDDGREGMVKMLLDHGADPSAAGKSGQTALHLAAANGNEEIAKLLLDHGADTTTCNTFKRTALVFAVMEGHEGMVKLLLERKADPSAVGHSGQTALHVAALDGHQGITKLLLEHGADPLATDSAGETPFHLAESKGNDGVVKLLLEKGAAPSTLAKGERTPSARPVNKEGLQLLDSFCRNHLTEISKRKSQQE